MRVLWLLMIIGVLGGLYSWKQRVDFDTAEGKRAAQAMGVRSVPATVIGQHLVRGFDIATLDQKLTPPGYDIY